MSNFYKLPSGIVFDMERLFAFHRNNSNGYLVTEAQNYVVVTKGDADALDRHFFSRNDVHLVQKADDAPTHGVKTVVSGDVSGPIVGDPAPQPAV